MLPSWVAASMIKEETTIESRALTVAQSRLSRKLQKPTATRPFVVLMFITLGFPLSAGAHQRCLSDTEATILASSFERAFLSMFEMKELKAGCKVLVRTMQKSERRHQLTASKWATRRSKRPSRMRMRSYTAPHIFTVLFRQSCLSAFRSSSFMLSAD